ADPGRRDRDAHAVRREGARRARLRSEGHRSRPVPFGLDGARGPFRSLPLRPLFHPELQRSMRGQLLRRATALLLSWIFTATSVWAAAPPATRADSAGAAAVPLPRLVPGLRAQDGLATAAVPEPRSSPTAFANAVAGAMVDPGSWSMNETPAAADTTST